MIIHQEILTYVNDIVPHKNSRAVYICAPCFVGFLWHKKLQKKDKDVMSAVETELQEHFEAQMQSLPPVRCCHGKRGVLTCCSGNDRGSLCCSVSRKCFTMQSGNNFTFSVYNPTFAGSARHSNVSGNDRPQL